jgi:uncharacterized protein
MTASQQQYGELRPEAADRCAVRFQRLCDVTADELWTALTQPAHLSGWLAEVSSLDLRPGGAIELDFGGGERMSGTLTRVEPPQVLEYTWTYTGEPESVVRFEIVPRARGVLLVLEHRRLTQDDAAAYGAGWHAHLDALEAELAGRPTSWSERYAELRPAYEERAAALGPDWAGAGGNALHEAVAAGDHERARELAARRPALRAEADAEGLLPAMRALYLHGRAPAEALAPPDDALDVFHAAALGRVARLRALLDSDSSLLQTYSTDGFTPLHLACFGGSEEAVRALLDHGADREAIARNRFAAVRPLGTAAFARSLGCARALLESGADPDGAGERGFRPLHTAAANGDVALVRLLLDHGADPGAATDDGRTAESLAGPAGHGEVVEALRARA